MTTSLLSRTPAQAERDSSFFATPTLAQVPTICLTTATPSISELQTTPSVLAPKAQSDNRKRLVPKKSKLSLLNNNSNNRTDRSTSKDFSDVSRRVGLPPSTGRTFDIYVDPADDPDIGEIVVLKKKKSRAGLNEVQWNALGDVTNTGEAKSNNTKHSNPDAPLKPKREEEKGDKWWTLGRSRHDSKSLKAKLKENDTGKENSKEKESKKSTIRRSRQSTRRWTDCMPYSPVPDPSFQLQKNQQYMSSLVNGPSPSTLVCFLMAPPLTSYQFRCRMMMNLHVVIMYAQLLPQAFMVRRLEFLPLCQTKSLNLNHSRSHNQRRSMKKRSEPGTGQLPYVLFDL